MKSARRSTPIAPRSTAHGRATASSGGAKSAWSWRVTSLAQNDLAAARNELLVAGGNAPDTPAIDQTLAGLLAQAGAPSDALAYYEKALAHDPQNQSALRAAGRLAFSLGDYAKARPLLERALRLTLNPDDQDLALLSESEQQLHPNPAPPSAHKRRR